MNTCLFHVVAFARRNKNFIPKLAKEDGAEVTDQGEMCSITKKYFEDIFSACQENYDPIIEVVKHIISAQGNEFLLTQFSEEDFRDVLFHIDVDKALGPDGMNLGFYRRFWDICKKDIVGA